MASFLPQWPPLDNTSLACPKRLLEREGSTMCDCGAPVFSLQELTMYRVY